MGRQYLGRYGKTDSGVVTVTTVWADKRVYYPVHAVPYTPACRQVGPFTSVTVEPLNAVTATLCSSMRRA